MSTGRVQSDRSPAPRPARRTQALRRQLRVRWCVAFRSPVPADRCQGKAWRHPDTKRHPPPLGAMARGRRSSGSTSTRMTRTIRRHCDDPVAGSRPRSRRPMPRRVQSLSPAAPAAGIFAHALARTHGNRGHRHRLLDRVVEQTAGRGPVTAPGAITADCGSTCQGSGSSGTGFPHGRRRRERFARFHVERTVRTGVASWGCRPVGGSDRAPGPGDGDERGAPVTHPRRGW